MSEEKNIKAAQKEIEKEKRQKRFPYRTLDAVLYKELCEWVKSYPIKRKRLDEIIDEITIKYSQSMRFSKGSWVKNDKGELVHEQHLLSYSGGGDGSTTAERATEAMEKAKTKYYSLFEDVEAVEGAIEYVKNEHQDPYNADNNFGERLAKAILLHCTNRADYTVTALINKFKLGMHENTFTWHKRLFIGNLAERRGLIGLLEIWG